MQRLKKYQAKVVMVKPYCDSYLEKPSNVDVLENFADLIQMGMLDDLFVVEVTEEQ